jgi:kinesin family member 13
LVNLLLDIKSCKHGSRCVALTDVFSAVSGKNDGSVKGVRYFSCAPKHGKFVRPDKVMLDKRGRALRSSNHNSMTSSQHQQQQQQQQQGPML